MLRNRYRRIVLFFAYAIISLVVWELLLPRMGLRGLMQRTRSDRLRRIAIRFRALAIRMGGVLIKVGQYLSSRLDVLPEEITSELADLQDEVPPENFADIRRVTESELGAPLSEKFAEFDEVPLAAASLGQAHRARLRDASGSAVVVKIQRPNIETIIATDLAALRTVGRWLSRYPPIRKRADVMALLAEFTRILQEEVDYLAEGRNAETFAANFKFQPGVRAPRVYWSHTTRHVLTLEDVYAIKITDYQAISAAGIDRAQVAQRLFDTYLQQIFEHNFFHADPHPGNLFVSPLDAEGDGSVDWQLTFVDFGMMGHVPPNTRAGLRELVIAVSTKDAARLVHAYQMLGVLLPNADLELLEKAEAKVFEHFWGKSMSELRQISLKEMREFAREFRGLIYNMPFQIPEDFILLGRTGAILSGMCSGLNPHFNVWNSLAPYARRLIAEETVSNWQVWRDELITLARALLALPKQIESVLSKMERGNLDVRVPQLAVEVARLELAVRRTIAGVIFAGLLVGGVQFYQAGQMLLGGLLLVGAAVALIWLISHTH